MLSFLPRPTQRRLGLVALAIWGSGALLSAIQIYAREWSEGDAPAWSEVLVANLLAWLPWPAIASGAILLERRCSLTGPQWRSHALLHGLVATICSASYLLYLAVFHLVYLEGSAWPPSGAALRAEYAQKLGRFFLTAVLLYAMIVVSSVAHRSWRRYRRLKKQGLPRATAREMVPEETRKTEAEATRKTGIDAAHRPAPIVVRSAGSVERIEPLEIRWVEGCGNYARLHLEGRTVLLRRTLASLAEELATLGFSRIHRSLIVNESRVVEMRRLDHGEAVLLLRDGSELKVSRTYRAALEKLFP